MDTMEFGKLVDSLDRQIARLKREADERARREEIQKQVRLHDHWIEGLEKRKSEIAALGGAPEADLDGILAGLRAERERLLGQLELRPSLSAEDERELDALADEAANSVLAGMGDEERWWLFEEWACRWRVVVNGLAKGLVDTDTRVRRVYARIRERMDEQPRPLWYIKALDKEESADWAARIGECRERIKAAAEARRAEDEREHAREEAVEAAVWNLMAAVREYAADRSKDNEAKLRHHLRQAAKHEHLREEAAELVRTHRNTLEPEFSFLWKDRRDEEEQAPKRRISNRDIVARLLRRMKAKCLIGACHGPLESVCNGFPEHDKGRAKEAMDALVKAEIIKMKPTKIGARVSIWPAMVAKADALIAGGKADVKAVDEWCANGA